MEWNKFDAMLGKRQKLPEEKKYVLVQLDELEQGKGRHSPYPIVVGYLKFHYRIDLEKELPYFVLPGCWGSWRELQWCDCLPDPFVLPDPAYPPENDGGLKI